MSAASAAVTAACGAAVLCSVLSCFVSDTAMKKVLGLVMGAFVVCSIIIPLKNINSCCGEAARYGFTELSSATLDQALQTQIVAETERGLEQTLDAIMRQNGVEPVKSEITLADSGAGGIIISRADIYIKQRDFYQTALIRELTESNFGIIPNIMTVEE